MVVSVETLMQMEKKYTKLEIMYGMMKMVMVSKTMVNYQLKGLKLVLVMRKETFLIQQQLIQTGNMNLIT